MSFVNGQIKRPRNKFEKSEEGMGGIKRKDAPEGVPRILRAYCLFCLYS